MRSAAADPDVVNDVVELFVPPAILPRVKLAPQCLEGLDLKQYVIVERFRSP